MPGSCPENDHRQECKEGKKKDPSEISDEISTLVSKVFPGKENLFREVKEAISSTRKTGKVSDSIILTQLKTWEKFPINQVHGGIRVYLEKGYYREGKKEAYLMGIIRNHRPGEKEGSQQFKPTGSLLLDAYYRKQAEKEAKAQT